MLLIFYQLFTGIGKHFSDAVLDHFHHLVTSTIYISFKTFLSDPSGADLTLSLVFPSSSSSSTLVFSILMLKMDMVDMDMVDMDMVDMDMVDMDMVDMNMVDMGDMGMVDMDIGGHGHGEKVVSLFFDELC